MRFTLAGLTADHYNGLSVQLIPRNGDDRACVQLECGKRIRVPFHALVVTEDMNLETCSICSFPCLPGYCSVTGCNHKFHTSCLTKWRTTAQHDIEAPGNRCPLCRSYQGTTGLFSWKRCSAKEVVIMALGAICQSFAHQNGMKEPTVTEELDFVLTCMSKCADNKQDCYQYLQNKIDAYNKNSFDKDAIIELHDALKRMLVVHVFYDETVDERYVKAIDAWLLTLVCE